MREKRKRKNQRSARVGIMLRIYVVAIMIRMAITSIPVAVIWKIPVAACIIAVNEAVFL